MMDRNLTFCGGSATTSSTVSTRARRMFAGLEVSGCGHGLVGRLSDVCGVLTRPRRAGSGIGMTWLAAICCGVTHLTPSNRVSPLFDGDLSFALGSHADDPGWSSQTRVISVRC